MLSLNEDNTKAIAYSDYDVMQITGKGPTELTSEDLEQFDYQGCIDYGEGYDASEARKKAERETHDDFLAYWNLLQAIKKEL